MPELLSVAGPALALWRLSVSRCWYGARMTQSVILMSVRISSVPMNPMYSRSLQVWNEV